MPSKLFATTCNVAGLPPSFGADSRRVVRREEYCALLVSRRHLERWDDGAQGQHCLFDVDSHELFVIPEKQLVSEPGASLGARV